MGRAKLAIKFIEDRKARNVTFCKRKEGLKKKAYEFATLCGVDTCLICYKEDSNQPITWPEDRAEVDRIIRRYLMVSEEERVKREMGLCLFDEKKKNMRMRDNLTTSCQENTKPMFPTWDDRLDNWPVPSLRELVNNLDEKIEMVKMKIKLLTSSNSNPYLEQSNQQVEVSSCKFPLHQPYPLSCVKTEEQHSSGKDFLQSPASLKTNSILNPSPLFEQFSDTDNFSSISTLPLFNQEVGVMPVMSQSNTYDGYSASIFHQQQCFQGNQCFGLSDFLPMNPESFQKMLLHSQTHHLDLGLPECQDFEVTS